MKNRSKAVMVMALCCALAVTACGTWESDVVSVLGVVNTIGTSLAAIIEVADPVLATPVTLALNVEQQADKALTALVQGLETDAASTTVGKIDAVVATLQQNTAALVAAAQVKDPTEQAQVTAVAAALEAAVSEIAGAIPQAAPATTVAELRREGWSLEVTDSPDPIPAPPAGASKPGTRTVHSAKYWKAHMKAILLAKSSHPEIDAVKAAEAKKY